MRLENYLNEMDEKVYPRDVTSAQKYIKKIKNGQEKDYAEKYLQFLLGKGPRPLKGKLSRTEAQEVEKIELQLRDYLNPLMEATNYLRCTRKKNQPLVHYKICEKCPYKDECKDYQNFLKKKK